MVGDSIGARIQSTLAGDVKATGATFNSDTLVSRNLSGTLPAPDGLNAVSQDSAEIKLADTVVVELGTNSSGFTSANVDSMINKIRGINASAKIYWVDVAVIDSQRLGAGNSSLASTLSNVNKIIYDQATADNYTVISWNKAVFGSAANPMNIAANAKDTNGYIDSSDGLGVHPTTDKGVPALATLITSGIGSDSGSTGQNCSCSTGSTTLTGSGPAQQAWNFFTVTHNLSPVQTAAILGNFQEESGLDPQRVQGGGESQVDPLDNVTGWGIAQWTSIGRQQALQDFANSQSQPVYSLALQLDFVWQEATAGGNIAAMRTVTDIQVGVDYWMSNYERPDVASEHEDIRLSDAKGFLQLYGNGTPTGGTVTPPTGSGCGGPSGSGSGSGSLPTGTASQLATQLGQYINNGSIKCTNSAGANNFNCSDITNTANGVSIKTGGCDVNALSPALLGMLLELVKMGHTFILSAICSDHGDTGTGSPGHSTGQAADFNTIDGTFMGPDDVPWSQAKITAGSKLDQDITSFMPPGSVGFGQIQCHPPFDFLSGYITFDDTCHHQHVQVEN
jgi:hypothetical protein